MPTYAIRVSVASHKRINVLECFIPALRDESRRDIRLRR